MKCKKVTTAKALFGFFNTIFFACGFVEVISGFLLLCDSRRVLLSRLLASPEAGLPEPPFYYLALALLVAGLTVCAVGALGCWATYMPGYAILTVYFLLVLSVLLCECAGGALVTLWPRCLGLHSVRGGAVGALQAYYGVPDYEQFTAALDLAQTELECCGMMDARNFDMSLWQLRRLGPRGLSVPLSCCVQDYDSGSYLNPVPLNQSQCQDVTPNAHYRHVQGCLGKLEDWYQEQYIVLLLALFVVALFKLGLLMTTVFSCVRLKRHRKDIHAYIMKSIDNKTNENIYEYKTNESKLGSLPDEPITAKYIQPNNYYSPRVRNPRIFYNKPNEMV